MECSHCFCKNFTVDNSRAEIICDDCGMVHEQTDTQRETEFEEMDNGRIAAVGHIISTGSHATKQNTINKASNKIYSLCSNLSLTKSLGACAVKIFESALSMGMTRGRNADITVGSCVYLAARIKQQSLMLLDVSDKLNVNVYVLGKTYNEIREKLGQRVSDVDPCLFIERFAMQLELGNKTAEVSTTALKLLQRMKKDWISTGRRPTGITAAALCIAARIHRFDRDCSDVARIAGVSHHTAKKRLQEWAQTSTADLTLEQFGKIEFEDEFDPPAFTNAKVEETIVNKISDEEFEKFKIEMNEMQLKFEEESSTNKRPKVIRDNLQRLVESVEKGEVDIESLIGTIDGDDEDALLEFEGRKELLGECMGMREAFLTLKKKEELVQEKTQEHELPLFLENVTVDDEDGRWPPKGMVLEEVELTDDEEFERIHICSREVAVMKLKVWIKGNKDYYKNLKKGDEKRRLKRQREEDTGKKGRGKRNKRAVEHMMDRDQLLSEIKEGLSVKVPMVCSAPQEEVEEERTHEDGDVEEEAEEEDMYKNEEMEEEEEYEPEPQYDFNE